MFLKYATVIAAVMALGTAGASAGPRSPAAAPQQNSVHGDCSLAVGGKSYLNIKKTCFIDFFGGDGSFSINTVEGDGDWKPRYFAYVTMNGDGTATVSWNGSLSSTHAHDTIGADFRRKGGCWIGKRGKLCAYRS